MAEDDDNDVNHNSTSAQFGMPLQSSSTRTTDGSSGEPTEHNSNSNSGNEDESSGQGSIKKLFRPCSPVLEDNSAEAALPPNGAVDALPASPQKKNCFLIDWNALDGPPELFDKNGDRQSLACSGGKRPKAKQLPPPTYLWHIGSIRKEEDIEEDEEVEDNHINETTVELLERLHRTLDEEDLKKYVPNTGDCLICSDDNCLLAIPQCNCREPCCHSCMFTHLEASYSRGQAFLCPFCQQPPVRLYYNIKSTFDYRIWVVHKFEPYTALYPLIRAIDLFEDSEVFGGVNPLCRITYASFISTIMRTPETDDLLILDPKQWFRAFVYIHDLIPWNYSAAQCTMPLPLCDEQAENELNRLKDFLGAELCYFFSTLNLPLDFDEDEMNLVLVQMRELVNGYASVQEYFERGEHFQNTLINLIPTDWTLKEDIVNFNINVPKKIYTESLHFLNSRAPSLDTYIKRVIYTNLPSDQLIYDPCLSRRDSRMLRTALLVASNSRLNAAHEDRQREIEAEDQLRQERMAQIMEIIHRRAHDVANEDVHEDNEGSEVLHDRAASRDIDSRANEAFQMNIVNLYLQSFGIDLDIYGADDPEESNELDYDLDDPIHSYDFSRDSVNLTPTGSDEDILEHEPQNVAESENQESRLSSINSPTSSSCIVLESVPMHSEQQASIQNSNLLADIGDYGSMNWSLCRENVSDALESASSQPQSPGSSSGSASLAVAADGANGNSSRHEHEERTNLMMEHYMAARIDAADRWSPTREVGDNHSNGDKQSNLSANSSIIASNEAGPPVRQSSVDPTRSPSRHSLDVGAPGKLDNSPTKGDEVEKLRTACIDLGPGYKYFMRQIYPEESDGDSDSDDEYITMRGKPSQWRRAKRSNRMGNRSSPSGTTNSEPDRKSSASPGQCMASTSGINRRQQDDQVSPRDVASTSKVQLDYSDSDSD